MINAKAAKAYTDLDRAEVRMVRAITKWTKLRAKVRRLDAKADKEIAEGLPGKLDVTKMPIKPKPWPNGKGSNRVIKVKLKNR